MTLFDLRKRIIAMLLIAALALPVAGYAAEPDEEGLEGTAAASELQSEETTEDLSVEEEPVEEVNEVEKAEAAVEQYDAKMSEEAVAAAEEEQKGEIILNAGGEDGKISVVWKPFDKAEYYKVYFDDAYMTDTTKCRYVSPDVGRNTVHSVKIEAYGKVTPEPEPQPGGSAGTKEEETEPQPQPEIRLIAEGSLEGITAVGRNRLADGTVKGAKLGINLKTLLGESRDGYSVVQGGCTDGTYAYYLLVSSSNQHGRILKTRISDNAVIGRSGVITDMEHGNGMTMDTTRNRLIISGRQGWKNRITAVDAGSLRTIRYYTLDYSSDGKWTSSKSNGISSIAYVKKYDCFIAVQRTSHELLVMDANVDESSGKCKVIGMMGTTITSKYPGTYQAMDADSRYVYILLSYYNRSQPYNKILVLDWNSENLRFNTYWKCNNDESGKPDAAIRVTTPYEAENIYHIDRGDGTSDFYLSEYYNHPKTKYVYKKKKVKVKWKKVRKKVKVKWEKVNGKWKYKKKWKKVWKYKKKWKKVKVKKGTYLNREAYVYALGRF